MSDESTKAKRRVQTRRLSQSTWRLFAKTSYNIAMASANACLPFLPVAFDSAGRIATLLWGGSAK
ncbi:hypothetical protein [uncultured Parasphingorhabdus sp.]|uniref:hypothetical protein n=1 Tax=uncultured Parasphingorhabdus sp. TaxID=2709694 RepID=UPI002AA61262|nr:hypothetical protein [uncultured Parasphingorhabdus sp.]